MQRWTRQSQCMFCQFRASLQKQCLLTENRPFHTSAAQYKERLRERSITRRHDVSRSTVRRHPDAIPGPRDTVPTRERRRELVFDKSIQDEDALDKDTKRRNEILRALRHTRLHYIANKMSKTSDISQMKGLDPGYKLWPQFESMVTEALDNSLSSGKRPGLITDLMNVPLDVLRPDTERMIQFAFMDYVLDNSDSIKSSSMKAIDMRYPTEWYAKTRRMQRVIHLHVGPTNSGKTYNALKRLEQAQDGFYAGPLRLLAHEVYSRFNHRGIKCDLVTGDDVRLSDSGDVNLYASTVEMVDSNRVSKVGIVDEIQMMGDNERGWAWTRALLAAKVEELHLCGEARVVPLVREIVASMGDTLHIHQYERLNPLKVMSRSLKGNLQNLRKGDCVVSFSIMNIHALKRQIEIDTGKRCAIIYGGLPPETRAQQASLFNDPDNEYDFLVASDAIGMGLNLSIKRIVFETTMKFNGTNHERLSIPQTKQIAGRAGRYRTARDDSQNQIDTTQSATRSSSRSQDKPQSIGLVTCLAEIDLPFLQQALSQDGPPLKAAGVLPPGEFFEDLASRLPEDTPFEYILRRMCTTVATNDRFRVCNIRDQMQIARAVEEVKDLSIEARLTLCASPASWRNSGAGRPVMQRVLLALAKAIEGDKGVTVADIDEVPLEMLDVAMTEDRSYLTALENLHKSLILFLWLSYRFPRIFREQDMAIRAKELCEEKINTTLLKFSANPKLRERLAEIRKSSELLREQAKEKGLDKNVPMTMNPDQTVEQMDSVDMQEEREQALENELGLEEKVEVEGELDLGDDEVIHDLVERPQSQQSLGLADDTQDGKEPQRAEGSG